MYVISLLCPTAMYTLSISLTHLCYSKLHVYSLILDYVVMFAADEAKAGDVVVKDMRTGSQVTVREELLAAKLGGSVTRAAV